MKKVVLLLFIVFNFTFLNANQSLESAIQKAKDVDKDVLLFIHSEYCYFCKDMIRNTLEDKEVKKFIDERFVFIMVNQRDKNLLRDDIKTSFVPITYIISQDGEILLELPGRKDKKTFISIIKDTLLE